MNERKRVISFEEHRAAAEADSRVRCPKCNKLIEMRSTRCEVCGVHFQGEAWQFSPSTDQPNGTSIAYAHWVVGALVVATIAWTLLAAIL